MYNSIISHATYQDCHVHIFSNNLSWNKCSCKHHCPNLELISTDQTENRITRNNNQHFFIHLNHNYNKILTSDWLSTALISALIGQYVSCLSNWTVCAITRALKWLFFSTGSKKISEFLVFWIKKKEPNISQILLKLWWIGNRTSCRPIRSVIILVIKYIGRPRFVNHLYDYRPNWTPLSPVTITNWWRSGTKWSKVCFIIRKTAQQQDPKPGPPYLKQGRSVHNTMQTCVLEKLRDFFWRFSVISKGICSVVTWL